MNTLTRRSIGHPKSPENPHQYRCKDITVQRQNDPSAQQTLRGVPACLSFSGRTEHLSYTQVDQRTGASRAEGMILYGIKWECHPPTSVIMILGKLRKLVNNNRFSYSLTTPSHLSASSYKAPRRCRSCSSITAWFVIRGKRQEELREEIDSEVWPQTLTWKWKYLHLEINSTACLRKRACTMQYCRRFQIDSFEFICIVQVKNTYKYMGWCLLTWEKSG